MRLPLAYARGTAHFPGESRYENTLAGRALRPANAAEEAGLHIDRGHYAGAWNRRDQHYLQLRQRHFAAPVAVSGFRAVGIARRDRGEAWERFDGSFTPQLPRLAGTQPGPFRRWGFQRAGGVIFPGGGAATAFRGGGFFQNHLESPVLSAQCQDSFS